MSPLAGRPRKVQPANLFSIAGVAGQMQPVVRPHPQDTVAYGDFPKPSSDTQCVRMIRRPTTCFTSLTGLVSSRYGSPQTRAFLPILSLHRVKMSVRSDCARRGQGCVCQPPKRRRLSETMPMQRSKKDVGVDYGASPTTGVPPAVPTQTRLTPTRPVGVCR